MTFAIGSSLASTFVASTRSGTPVSAGSTDAVEVATMGGDRFVKTTALLAPGTADADEGRRDAGPGRRGAVRQLQFDLKQLGYFKGFAPTGGYYHVTRDAVRRFQSDHGLVATGKADAATQSAISGATGDSTSSSAPHSALVPAPRPVSAPAPRLVPAPAPRLVPAPAPRPVPALALHPVPAPALRPVPAPALSPVLAPALSPVPAPALRQPSAALVNPTSTAPGTTVPAAPARPALSASSSNSARLASISQSDLAHLGRTNKPAFFETLRPGAEEIERRFGVPASVTMGQIAYETGYGAHVPGGDSYNLFGHKGVGPAGSVRAASYERNHSQLQVSPFRKYHDFAEAMMDHGQVMAAGYYHRALSTVAGGNADPKTFLRNIEGIYHQDGHQYTSDVMGIIRRYDLERPSES